MLKRDLAVLDDSYIVDFSLFVHVFERVDAFSAAEDHGLSPEAGCITEPQGSAVICFSIIDFLLEYTVSREFESILKHDKFEQYPKKLLQAFDCLGSLSADGCEGYLDYNSILQAGESEAKAVLMGTSTFRESYECKAEAPRMKYKVFGSVPFFGTNYVSYDRPQKDAVPFGVLESASIQGGNFSYDGQGYDERLAAHLQFVSSREHAARIVGNNYTQFFDQEYQSSGLQLSKEELAACQSGIEEFATNTWTRYRTNHGSLGNVLWSPTAKSLFVVRGKNRFYSNDQVASKMRGNRCFLKTILYRCQPTDGSRVVLDYKRTFGSVEVLQVVPSVSSGRDLDIYREGLKAGLIAP